MICAIFLIKLCSCIHCTVDTRTDRQTEYRQTDTDGQKDSSISTRITWQFPSPSAYCCYLHSIYMCHVAASTFPQWDTAWTRPGLGHWPHCKWTSLAAVGVWSMLQMVNMENSTVQCTQQGPRTDSTWPRSCQVRTCMRSCSLWWRLILCHYIN